MDELELRKIMEDQVMDGLKYFYRNISVDSVIIGYHEKELKVLLQRPQNFQKWGLPGGYVFKTETVDDAAFRIVQYRTQLDNLFLHQFKVFSNPDRVKDAGFTPEIYSKITGIKIDDDHWMFDNFVSIAFFALTEFSLVQPTGSAYLEECCWWDINNLPELLFDHADIIKEALKALKIFIHHHPIGYELLPEKFTLPELHSLYETILNKKLDIRNFTKKLVSMDLITKLDEQRNIGAHRSPYLYMFNKERYDQLINEEEVIVI
ncbi:MAG: NUDIX domain-containing protein [Bacteroidota bacterium]|nr:NUDIX domain-containing protein [Bacteroidota bacterium]